MALSPAEREKLIQQYADGPRRLREALATVPAEALAWRPAPGEWSAQEVVCHCADSEMNAARASGPIAEKQPTIIGYDQEEWARALDYAGQPIEPALRRWTRSARTRPRDPAPAGRRVEPARPALRVWRVRRRELARDLRRSPRGARAPDRGGGQRLAIARARS